MSDNTPTKAANDLIAAIHEETTGNLVKHAALSALPSNTTEVSITAATVVGSMCVKAALTPATVTGLAASGPILLTGLAAAGAAALTLSIIKARHTHKELGTRAYNKATSSSKAVLCRSERLERLFFGEQEPTTETVNTLDEINPRGITADLTEMIKQAKQLAK